MAKTGTGYSMSDHPNLAGGNTRELFEALRKQVHSLDANVTEEFLARYIAYKAETNFVDVIPLAKGLRLILNLKSEELEDPRGVCRDVSSVGHWGNGDVEVMLTSADELQYVIGLIRQSFEHQVSAEAAA
jgi:predicted transport protein